MKNELAKQLKDAGFNQERNHPDTAIEQGGELVEIPTLQELIDAIPPMLERKDIKHGAWFSLEVICGDGKTIEGWDAGYGDAGIKYLGEQGKTPTEAVAKLYIALNQPPKE